MTEEDRDRILQLVAYVQQAYHGEYRRYAQIPTALINAHELCNAVVKSIGWVSAYPSITIRWSEEATCFNCPCGVKDIVLSEGDDTVKCDCGRTYRLRHYVEVDQVPAAQQKAPERHETVL
jgi:hypothetical protein